MSRATGNRPMIALQEGRFPRAVGADQRHDLALAQVRNQRHRAPENRHSGRRAHGWNSGDVILRSPYRRAGPRGSSMTSAAAPSAIFSPKFSTSSRSATASSACSTCSIQTIVTPAVADPAAPAPPAPCTSSSVSPPAISSSSSSFGSERQRTRQFQPLAIEQRQRAGQHVGLARTVRNPRRIRRAKVIAVASRDLPPAKLADTSRFSKVVMPQ